MKKLLVNGCSFVAGDALIWDRYIEENNIVDLKWMDLKIRAKNNKVSKEEEFHFNYYRQIYRRKYNLPAMLANKLDTEFIDISEDGNSNDTISMTTILYLLNIPEKERSKYHVVVGWTGLPRRLKFSKIYQKFISLNNNFSIHLTNDNPLYNELKNYAQSMKEMYDEDNYLNYISSIMLLENFLKLNNCTYTFFRSLGIEHNKNLNIWPVNEHISFLKEIDKKKLSDDKNWYKINKNSLSFDSISFGEKYILGHKNKNNRIDVNNPHPTYKMVNWFAGQLVDFIKNQKIDFN